MAESVQVVLPDGTVDSWSAASAGTHNWRNEIDSGTTEFRHAFTHEVDKGRDTLTIYRTTWQREVRGHGNQHLWKVSTSRPCEEVGYYRADQWSRVRAE